MNAAESNFSSSSKCLYVFKYYISYISDYKQTICCV